jgi:2-iminobutanoate/2-iminopropanoate deaminase
LAGTTGKRRYGIVSADERQALTGLEFVQGLLSGVLPLNTMAQTLGYDIVEVSHGRVVVGAKPSGLHLNPAGTVHGGLSATLLDTLPPFDPATGEIKRLPFKQQAEIVIDQMKRCVESAGSSLDRVVKRNVYCTPHEAHFPEFNEIYARYFPVESPARIFLHVPSWPGPFDIEVDCVAVL